MNLLDAIVTKILSEPEFKYYKWFIDVEYECYGVKDDTSLMFNSEEEARGVKIGYKFLT